MAFVAFQDVGKIYKSGEVKVQALRDATFQVEKGELCVIVGPSGAGKTTLLNILGGMDTLTSGKVFLDGAEVSAFNLTALENVELASQICRDPLDPGQVLRDVGLANRAKNFPAQLSGGEQQRVAIARALAKNPKLLLCDEPTGALDYNTGKAILKLLQDTGRQTGMTVIIITHNSALTAMADRVVQVKNGTVVDSRVNPNPRPVSEIEW